MEDNRRRVPKTSVTEASPRKDKNKGKQKEVSWSPSPPHSSISSKSRKRGASKVEHLLEVVEQGESRKRRCNAGIEHTKRLEAQGKLEIRCMELEMAEHAALCQHEFAMEKLCLYGTESGVQKRDTAVPLELGMKRMDLEPTVSFINALLSLSPPPQSSLSSSLLPPSSLLSSSPPPPFIETFIARIPPESLDETIKDISAVNYQK